ncbi:hypothetical protein [Herbaspirillum frisingense]|uniref:hypothetical protein n=1 Tax=Herbaspirillum frisingense TaxID=92645 RepID=UPI0039AF369B
MHNEIDNSRTLPPAELLEVNQELQQENQLLLRQSVVLQEELERLQALPPAATVRIDLIDDHVVQAHADNLANAAFIAAWKRNLAAERRYAAANGRLSWWRRLWQHMPGADRLGGKSFAKVIAAYASGGARAVDVLFDQCMTPPELRAKALTVLARSLQKEDAQAAADLARKAYDLEPRPFRLKWLALRQYEAGVMEQAQANLDCLPEDVSFSESELRQVEKLRQQTQRFWHGKAMQLTNFSERQAALRKQAGEALEKTSELQQRVATLEARKTTLEQEQAWLRSEYRRVQQENAALQIEQGRLQEERAALVGERDMLAEQLRVFQQQVATVLGHNQALTAQMQTLLSQQDQLQKFGSSVQEIQHANAAAGSLMADAFRKQSEELLKVRRHLDNVVKNEALNVTRQVQAFLGVQSYFASGELPMLNSEHHSWAIDMDLAHYLVELIECNAYDLVIEFGSGISTTVVAKALQLIQARAPQRAPARFVSFDHLEPYFQKTVGHLRQLGLEHYAQVCLAPLSDWQSRDGKHYPFYACEEILSALARETPATARILVIVDGPPAATGQHARYPALPLILAHFAERAIDVLMDDYVRADEKEVAQMWLADIGASGQRAQMIEKKLHKDACLIEIRPTLIAAH